MQSPLRWLVLAMGTGNTCCTARFLKQADFPGSFLQGSRSAAPHPPLRTVKGSTLLPRLQGEPMPLQTSPKRHSPGSERERHFSLDPPHRRVRGARTQQGGTDQTPRLSASVDTVQRAQRPFPDLPEGCGRTSAFPGLAPAQRRRAACHGGVCIPPRPHPLPALRPLGDWEPAAFW